jgi:hypothetical protein
MKIFSLQSKTYLAVWSVVLGVLINLFLFYPIFLFAHSETPAIGLPMPGIITDPKCFPYGCPSLNPNPIAGWPVQYFKADIYNNSILTKLLLNLLFWILAVYIILNLIRYFKTKKV